MSMVTQMWVQNGYKGFLELSIITGDGDSLQYHNFFLNQQQTDAIAAEMSQALSKGLGWPKPNLTDQSPYEDFMQVEVALQFPGLNIGIGRPFEWKVIWRTGNEICIKTSFGAPVEITFASEAIAKHALECLLDNTFRTIEVGLEVTRMFFCDGLSTYAQGLSAEEAANLNAQFKRVSDCEWRMHDEV